MAAGTGLRSGGPPSAGPAARVTSELIPIRLRWFALRRRGVVPPRLRRDPAADEPHAPVAHAAHDPAVVRRGRQQRADIAVGAGYRRPRLVHVAPLLRRRE